MASGSVSGSIRSGYYTYRMDWSSSPSVADNESTITVNHYLVMSKYASLYIGTRTNNCTFNEYKEFTSPSVSNGGGSAKTVHLGTTTHKVSHNSDGKKSLSVSGTFYIKATISDVYYDKITASGTITLDDIPRQANLTSAPDFNDEDNPKISYSNPAGNSASSLQACISLTGATDDIAYRDISKTGSSYTFNLTDEERKVLRDACTTSNTRKVTFFVKTVIGDNTFYSTLEKTLTITNANPTFSSSNISYQDTDSDIVDITGNNQHIVQNQSNLKITISNATAKKSASIIKYEVTFNGNTKTLTDAGTIDYGKVNLSSNSSVSIKVTDSRGNTTIATKSITILGWTTPSAIINATRVNNYEDETKLKVSVTISSVNSKNSISSIKYRYKKAGTSSYSEYVSLNNNVETTLTLDKMYAFDFQVLINDKFGSTTYNFVIATGTPIMFIDTKLQAIGVNCFPTKKNSFAVNGFEFDNLHPINSVMATINNNNPTSDISGTWELLTSQSVNGNTIYYWKRTA